LPGTNEVSDADPHNKGLVLVVDDEPMVCVLASAALERWGFSVLVAKNGKEAVEAFRLRAAEITIVLLDLTMPVMGGAEAFVLMNEIRPGVPIIVSSGYPESMVREQFSSTLAGVISKPYTMAALREKIAEVLSPRTDAGRSAGV
jgi:CheY-like chemotaxis protein